MNTAADEYNIFMLETETISRLEIGDSASKWHDIGSTILYGEYKRRVLRVFGDDRLGRLYKDTVQNAKIIEAAPQITSKWKDGDFYRETVKFGPNGDYYGCRTKTGRFHSECCRYGGVTVEVYVYDEACAIDLPPFNRSEYKGKRKRPAGREDNGEYSRCVYLAAVFEELFKSYVKKRVDMNSDESLCALLYGKLKIPVLEKDENGLGSVSTKTLRALADIKKDTPSSAFKSSVTDKNGGLVLSAETVNAAEYPAAVYLFHYRRYAERAGRLKENPIN